MLHSGVFIGIDHGGSTTTSLVFDPEVGEISSHSVPMPKRMPQIGWVEHDPDDFFETSMISANRALEKARLSWADVQGIGFANQGETSMAWSQGTGKSIGRPYPGKTNAATISAFNLVLVVSTDWYASVPVYCSTPIFPHPDFDGLSTIFPVWHAPATKDVCESVVRKPMLSTS